LDLFNFYLKELREKGILMEIHKKYDSPDQFCPDYSGKSLGFNSCVTAFVILIVGLCFALFLFSIETCAHYFGFHIPCSNSYGRKHFNTILDKQKLDIWCLKAKVKGLESQILGMKKYPYVTKVEQYKY
jgi:hypothetical protein